MASLQAAAPLPGLAGLDGARTTGGAVVRGSGRAARGAGAGAGFGSAGTGCTAGGLAGMDAADADAGAWAGAGSGTLTMGAAPGCTSAGAWRCSALGYIRSGKASISSARAINNNSENSQSLPPQSGRMLAPGAAGAIERLAEIE